MQSLGNRKQHISDEKANVVWNYYRRSHFYEWILQKYTASGIMAADGKKQPSGELD